MTTIFLSFLISVAVQAEPMQVGDSATFAFTNWDGIRKMKQTVKGRHYSNELRMRVLEVEQVNHMEDGTVTREMVERSDEANDYTIFKEFLADCESLGYRREKVKTKAGMLDSCYRPLEGQKRRKYMDGTIWNSVVPFGTAKMNLIDQHGDEVTMELVSFSRK